ncbi:MAG: hypothetical protein HQM10_11400 [Candidatus Riflebacteria bacterium]|nr:hypothetical protein [Candidatus Riflebacteria bacterium]
MKKNIGKLSLASAGLFTLFSTFNSAPGLAENMNSDMSVERPNSISIPVLQSKSGKLTGILASLNIEAKNGILAEYAKCHAKTHDKVSGGIGGAGGGYEKSHSKEHNC